MLVLHLKLQKEVLVQIHQYQVQVYQQLHLLEVVEEVQEIMALEEVLLMVLMVVLVEVLLFQFLLEVLVTLQAHHHHKVIMVVHVQTLHRILVREVVVLEEQVK